MDVRLTFLHQDTFHYTSTHTLYNLYTIQYIIQLFFIRSTLIRLIKYSTSSALCINESPFYSLHWVRIYEKSMNSQPVYNQLGSPCHCPSAAAHLPADARDVIYASGCLRFA